MNDIEECLAKNKKKEEVKKAEEAKRAEEGDTTSAPAEKK